MIDLAAEAKEALEEPMAAVEHDEAVGEAIGEAVGESAVLQPASCHLWSTRDCLDLIPLELAQVLLHS